MKKYIYSIVAATALFASCSQDAELNEIGNADSKAITTIGASTEISTRAVVSSTDNTKINWETGDQLGVFGTNSSSEAKNLAYTLNSGSGTTSGTFSNGSSDITAISAIMYPYQENATWADSKLTCEIPYMQTAAKGSFDKAAAIMYSIGNTTDVTLNYAVNFLKVTVTEENVHSISISSTTTALSGKMEITSGGVAAASGSLNSVTLTAGKGNVLAAGDYYIAVKAGNIENPSISYVYYNDDHTATEKTKAGSGTLTFAENTNVKPVKVNFTNGTVTTRKAVQLWANGPYFAEYNVGVTDGKAESYGGYYTWGGTYNNDPALEGNQWTDDHNTANTATDLSGSDDTATKLWGANWRMPTEEEFEQLIYYGYCQCEQITQSNVYGLLCTGKNAYISNSIFFPAAGLRWKTGHNYQGSDGYYWSSTHNNPPYNAYRLYFKKSDYEEYREPAGVYNDSRDYGQSVRAVLAD